MKLSYKTQLNILKKAGIFISSFLILFTFSGCKLLPKEEAVVAPSLIETPKVTYNTVDAAKGSIVNKLSAQGNFVSARQQDLFFQQKGGNIAKVYVKAGDTVKAGDVLAELNTDDIQEQIKEETLNVQIAQLDLDETKANKDATSFDIQKCQLALEKEQLAMDNLNGQLNKAKLIADIGGTIVYSSDPKVGSYVDAYQTLFTVADPKDVQIKCTGKTISSSFKVGMKVNIIYGDKTYTGVIATAADNVPANSDKYIVIKPDSLPSGIKLGDTVSVNVELQKKDNVIVISKDLVKKYAERPYVELLVNGAKVERYIETGIESDTTVEVVKGLNEGDKIIK